MLLFVMKIFRALFLTIDNAIYQCVDLLYQLFIMLAETGIFSSARIREFSERIYFFLGLIMLFKVSISILQFIMNPDSAKDSKMGAPKLLKNIVVVLIGIVMVPYVFEAAYSLQRIVLQDNIIGNLILGLDYVEDEDGKSYVNSAGDRMAFSTFTAFFRLNEDYFDNACANNPLEKDPATGEYVLSQACQNDENSAILTSFLNSSAGAKYEEAYKDIDMHAISGSWSIYNYTIDVGLDEEVFLFDYTMIVCSIAGVFLAYILLLFCFDVAVRSVKLGFLQLIAPIPLIAKIDPKKGDEVFSKWIKECTSTYISLFIRLAAIYFAIFIISITLRDGMFNVVSGDDVTNPFVFVFIIFGTLLFVKDLPKLIETITGMKMSGTLSLNKKLRSVPLIGGAAAQGVGLAGRTAGRLAVGAGRAGFNFARGRIGHAWNNSAMGQRHAQRVVDGIDLRSRFRASALGQELEEARGLVNDVGRGIRNAAVRFDDMSGNTLSTAFREIGTDARITGTSMLGALETSIGALDRRERALAAREGAILAGQTNAKNRVSQRQAVTDVIKKLEERAWERITTGQGGVISDEHTRLEAALTVAQNGNDQAAIEAAKAALYNFKDAAIQRYITGAGVAGSGVAEDAKLNNIYKNYVATVAASDRELGIASNERNGSLLHGQLGALTDQIFADERSMIAENQELSEIKEERRRIAETRRAGKESMGPGFGPGGGPK